MVDFLNKPEIIDHKYQTNGTVIDDSYKWKFSCPMKDFVPFWTDRQSMYFMSAIVLKDKIDDVRVLQF